MAREITSKHLVGATELTVIMPIRQEFVDVRDTITYATRLRAMLRILNGIRQASREAVISREYVGPIERLGTINDARFSIINNDRSLLLSVTFDTPLEPYIRAIRDDAGPLLDAICSHCVGYTGSHRSSLGYEKFLEWVRMYQVEVDFFYNAQPAATTDDYRYLRQLEARQRQMRDHAEFDRTVPELTVKPALAVAAPIPDKKERLIRQGLRAVKAMYALNALYRTDSDPGTDAWRERRFWIQAAQAVLTQFESRSWVPSGSALRKKYHQELAWFETKLESEDKSDVRPPAPSPEDYRDIQGNIIKPYKNMNYGLLVLVGFSSAEDGRRFLGLYKDKITVAEGSDHHATARNLAITRHGIEMLDVPHRVFRHFPKEFREGMEGRSGMLGDVRANHPQNWNLPNWNWPVGRHEIQGSNTVRKVPLSTVDVVIQIQAGLDTENPASDAYNFDDSEKYRTLSDQHPLYTEVADIDAIKGVRVLSVQPLRRKFRDDTVAIDGEDSVTSQKRFVEDHFGYADGISQPRPSAVPESRDDVSFGELLRGYRDDKAIADLHESATSPTEQAANDLMNNGSFLVVRKLRQYVGRFNSFIEEQSAVNDIGQIELKGKLIGRTPDGKPMLPVTHIQDFDFDADKSGHRCPFQSHIRRTNPRQAPGSKLDADPHGRIRKAIPRIMRRGFSYGPRFSTASTDDADRGLVFMSYSASIAEQYEIIQRWITGGNSTGILSAHDDPLLGVPPPQGEARTFRFYRDTHAARCELRNEHFVTLQWGMYLFVPSIRAIDMLAAGIRDSGEEPGDVAEGMAIIKRLQTLDKVETDKTIVRDAWKAVLEDGSARMGGVTKSVWAAVRKKFRGLLGTPYGLLVATHQRVMKTLDEPATFSVREYWRRMDETIGAGFLGMDPEPQPITDPNATEETKEFDEKYRDKVRAGSYESQAAPVNAEIYKITEELSYPVARRYMLKTVIDPRNKRLLDLRRIGGLVMLQLCHYYFGVPRRPLPDTIRNFLFVAKYVFSSPRPTDYLATKAKLFGKEEYASILEFVKRHRTEPFDNAGIISEQLFAMDDQFPNSTEGNEHLARTIAGLSNGMIAPTLGSFLSMTAQLIESGHLWRTQQRLLLETTERNTYSDVERVIVPVILRSLYSRPVPDIVHRTNSEPVPCSFSAISGNPIAIDSDAGHELRAGSRVILGIESATHDVDVPNKLGDAEVIFGGKYIPGASTGTHACSGARMAVGILAGMLTALLEAGNLKLENAPLTLSRNATD